jgi:hypothetical protein
MCIRFLGNSSVAAIQTSFDSLVDKDPDHNVIILAPMRARMSGAQCPWLKKTGPMINFFLNTHFICIFSAIRNLQIAETKGMGDETFEDSHLTN